MLDITDFQRHKRKGGISRAQTVKKLMDDYSGIPDTNHRRRKAVTCGKRTKMGIQQFLATIFEMNELNPRSKKLTNAAIQKLLLDEFPNRPNLHRNFDAGKTSINYYRHLYNSGRLTNRMPANISFRYNEVGIAVEPRHGKRPLTVPEKQQTIERYRKNYLTVSDNDRGIAGANSDG